MPISFLLPWDYERGFAEYAASQERSYAEKLPGIPVWKGEDPRGKAIVIASFVGRSDLIMFARYILLSPNWERKLSWLRL